MTPRPGILPIVAPSQSPPQSLVVTADDTTTTTTASLMTIAQTMTVKSESANTMSCDSVTKPAESSTAESTAPSSTASDNSGIKVEGQETGNSCSNDNSQKTEVTEDSKKSEEGVLEESSDDATNSKDNSGRPRQILLKAINAHIICNLCRGYLIDATTIVECLHSFCHSCIMKHLRTEQYCPRCEMMINTAKPNIKSDTTLQAIVYKLVPGLYEKELMRKRAFYRDRPEDAMLATPEQRGEDTEHLIFSPTENMSLSLEYADIEQIPEDDVSGLRKPKYLQCPAIFTVAHLKKFVILKFNIDPQLFTVEIMYKVKTILLLDHYTLMDVAYIYTWKRDAPMKFFFRVKEKEYYERKKKKSCEQNIVKEEGKPITSEEKAVECTSPNKEEREKQAEESAEVKQEETKGTDERSGCVEEIENKEGPATKNVEDRDETEERPEEKQQAQESEKSLETSQTAEEEAKKEEDEIKIVDVTEVQQPKIDPVKDPPPSDSESSKNNISDNPEPAKGDTSSPSAVVEETVPKEVNLSEPESAPDSPEGVDKSEKSEVSPEPKAEKLKITLGNKNKQPKVSSASSKSPTSESSSSPLCSKPAKGNKTPKHSSHHSSHHKSPPEQEERKVENIKLKIDLTKQNSVTIINMSGPDNVRKEVVKPVKPEREWKLKTKKDKDKDRDKEEKTSPKSSPGSETKHQRFEIRSSPAETKGVVPPITLKAERISPSSKKSPTLSLSVAKKDETTTKSKDEEDEEEKKSEFLNSFALTPIKSCTSPEKGDKAKLHTSSSFTPASQSALVNTLTSTATSKSNLTSKRKAKDSTKPPAKKVKTESTKGIDQKIKSNVKVPSFNQPSISFKLAPFPIGAQQSELSKKQEDQKLMPAPPPVKALDIFKKNGVKSVKGTKSSKSQSSANKMKTTTLANNGRAPPGSLTPHPMIPQGLSKIPITASAPGNRTPIARRYPPILPKSPRPNPFANIPADVNKLLNSSGTEIKEITNTTGKVYGPPANLPSGQKLSMAPPSPPVQQQANSMPASRGVMKSQNSNNYLNYALHNASKAKLAEVSLGCRTPIYTPNSPIYSPNSPQYMPNYNIPTQPTYKYTKSTSSSSNYLQSFLGQNKQLSNLFPAPPIKKPPEPVVSSGGNSKSPPLPVTSNPDIEIKKGVEENTLKRPYPFSNSPPSAEKSQEPPEKQTKVQSLLNSCNINIPSSLSITITNEDSESNTNNPSNPKHKSPVNNYIEILKLPDNQPISPNKPEQTKSNSSQLKTPHPPKQEDIRVVPTSSPSSSTLPSVSSSKTPIPTPVTVPKLSPKSAANNQAPQNVNPPSAKTSPSPKQLPSLNPIEKKQSHSDSNPASPKSPSKAPSPEKKSIQKKSSQPAADKKGENTPQNKSSKNSNEATMTQSTKKFRHILPRTTTPPQGTLKSATTSSPTAGSKNNSKLHQKATQSSSKKSSNNNSKKLSDMRECESASGSPKLSITQPQALNSSKSPTSSVVGSTPTPGVPDITSFINETLLRAQQQSSASASNVFLPHLAAAANFNPHFASVNFGYNIQQAYLMEHITRMQKAGHEALEKYMQKLKASSANSSNNPKGANSNNTSKSSDSKDSV